MDNNPLENQYVRRYKRRRGTGAEEAKHLHDIIKRSPFNHCTSIAFAVKHAQPHCAFRNAKWPSKHAADGLRWLGLWLMTLGHHLIAAKLLIP